MPELLLEFLSEDIPARMQARAADELKRLVTMGLEGEGLTFERADAYATPRRLALVVDGLPKRQSATKESRRGPSVDAPDAAIDGFAKSVGLTRDALKTETHKKGEYYVANVTRGGRAVRDVIAGIVKEAIWGFSWSKSMAWGEEITFKWVRPLQSILCIFEGKTVKFDLVRRMGRAEIGKAPIWISPHGLTSGNQTVGHRFLAPKRFKTVSFADYEAKLREAKVILSSDERRSLIESELRRLADAEGLCLKVDAGLLDEVAGIVEWPVVLLGGVDEHFMGLPDEVLTTVMRRHQKYFSLVGMDGALAPRFAVVANIEATDGGTRIVEGNERVLAARLADAQYFWDQDRKRTLEGRLPELGGLIFHAKLGSVADKSVRLQTLVQVLAQYIPEFDIAIGQRAGLLAKTDLTTGMVGEFPELQGIMGCYYALHKGARPEVATAIAEHYSPLGPSDRCPSAPVSVALALADKIDTLVGFWAIDEKPTGSRDPYALRRAALGVIRLIVENELRVPLLPVFVQATTPFLTNTPLPQRQELATDLLTFFAGRLKVHLRERGVRHDLISAVFALGGEDDLVRLLARVDVLAAFLNTDDGANLLTAFRRAANILRIEEKNDGVTYDGTYDTKVSAQDEEGALGATMLKSSVVVDDAVREGDFSKAVLELAKLRRPVDDFFDRVTVNADDPALRKYRLGLLAYVTSTMNRVADFSQIEG
jgi:glycyl-tRNA synthetase beta chain